MWLQRKMNSCSIKDFKQTKGPELTVRMRMQDPLQVAIVFPPANWDPF